MAEPSNGPTGWGRIRRGLVALGATALAAFAVSAVSAGAAQAQDPLDFTFDEIRVNLGDNKGVALVDPAVDDPATLSGEIDPATGDFTIPASGVDFPGKVLQIDPPAAPLPVDALIEITTDEPVTGNFDSTTGVLDVDTMNVAVRISVSPRGQTNPLGVCEVSPVPLPLQTTGEIVDDTDPANPVTYSASPFAPPAGEGAAVATWTSLPDVTVINDPTNLVCPAVSGLVAGPGGIWTSGFLGLPPGAPELALSVSPRSKTVKQGKGATFTATVRNTGDADATGVKVCMKAPRKAVKPSMKCTNVGTLAAGELEKPRFAVRAKRNAKPRSYTLRFRATGTGGPDNTTATLKVKRK
jgi:CARDB